MKAKLKDISRVVSFIILSVALLSLIGKFFCYNDNAEWWNINGLRSKSNDSIDVVFLGSSEVFTDYSPNLAWHIGGFTSYNYGTNSEPISMIKYTIDEVEKTQKPQLYIIEIYGATYNEDMLNSEIAFRRYVDNIPLTDTRVKAIIERQSDNWQNYLFSSLPQYHSNYKDVFSAIYWLRKSFLVGKQPLNYLNGAYIYCVNTSSIQNSIVIQKDESSQPLYCQSEQYLVELLEYIKEKEINVLFVFNPHLFDDENYYVYQRANEAGRIITEYGYDFINYSCDIESYGFDRETDFKDLYHMNIHGQEKFTRIIADEIISRIKIQTKSDEIIDEWNRYYDYYEEQVEIALRNCENGTDTLNMGGDE